MAKINCNVIGDILPLYADEAVSEDTKTLVEEHLVDCEECKERYQEMKREIEEDIRLKAAEAERSALLAAKKKIRKKRIITAIFSCIIGVIVIVATVYILNNIRIPVAYEKDRFKLDYKFGDFTNQSFYFQEARFGGSRPEPSDRPGNSRPHPRPPD